MVVAGAEDSQVDGFQNHYLWWSPRKVKSRQIFRPKKMNQTSFLGITDIEDDGFRILPLGIPILCCFVEKGEFH